MSSPNIAGGNVEADTTSLVIVQGLLNELRTVQMVCDGLRSELSDAKLRASKAEEELQRVHHFYEKRLSALAATCNSYKALCPRDTGVARCDSSQHSHLPDARALREPSLTLPQMNVDCQVKSPEVSQTQKSCALRSITFDQYQELEEVVGNIVRGMFASARARVAARSDSTAAPASHAPDHQVAMAGRVELRYSRNNKSTNAIHRQDTLFQDNMSSSSLSSDETFVIIQDA